MPLNENAEWRATVAAYACLVSALADADALDLKRLALYLSVAEMALRERGKSARRNWSHGWAGNSPGVTRPTSGESCAGTRRRPPAPARDRARLGTRQSYPALSDGP